VPRGETAAAFAVLEADHDCQAAGAAAESPVPKFCLMNIRADQSFARERRKVELLAIDRRDARDVAMVAVDGLEFSQALRIAREIDEMDAHAADGYSHFEAFMLAAIGVERAHSGPFTETKASLLSSFFLFLCHPETETANLIIINKFNSSFFKGRLDSDQC
jgi:hypothetical protein